MINLLKNGNVDMSNKAKIREEIKYLNPMDDNLFSKMGEHKDFCRELVQIILKDTKIKVKSNQPQVTLKKLQGRSLLIDLECILSNAVITNVEVQKENNADHQRRVRYHGSMLTTNITDPSTDFKNIPNVIVIYITAFDVFSKKKTIYHIDRVVRETQDTVDNGFNEIYVNSAVDDGSEIALLMKYFVGKDVDMDKARKLFPNTVKLKEYYTNTEKGIEIMTDLVKKLVKEEEKQIREDTRREIVQNLKRENLEISLIQKISGWSIEKILDCPV